MTTVFADIETDGFNPTKIWVISLKVLGKGGVVSFTDMKAFAAWVVKNSPTVWVFHNGLNFDVPAINKLTDVVIDPSKVIDTFVVSTLMDYNKHSTHSLSELGEFLGCPKSVYTGGFDSYSEEMRKYCEQDVTVLERIYKHQESFIKDPRNKKALRVEHDIASICHTMQENGFPFNTARAESLLHTIKADMSILEVGMQADFPPSRVEEKRIQFRKKKDGALYPNVIKAIIDNPDNEMTEDGEHIVFYTSKVFNPASPKDRIDRLWDSGWSPTEKTKGHIKWEREQYKKGKKPWRK